MNGYGMLICQAILADEIYLDNKVGILVNCIQNLSIFIVSFD